MTTDLDELNNELKRVMRKGDVDRAMELVQAGARVSGMDLGYAITAGWAPLVAAMVKVTNYTMATLFWSSMTVEIATILLETGRVDLDEALQLCVTKHREVAELLIRCGANPATLRGSSNCLHLAISGGSVDTVKWLLSLGVPETAQTGATLMHLVRTVDMIRFLAARGHPIDEVDAKGQTPLHHVSELMAHEARDELVRRGADSSRRDNAGRTPDDLLGLAWEAERSRPY